MDVRRKAAGSHASWSLVVFDEAHRLTPTSQYLTAARQVADRTNHLLLMTATPHRGKEHYFRALMNLLDPLMYPWSPSDREYEDALVPSRLSFLRRMKEDLVDHDGEPLFKPRFSETVATDMTASEDSAYNAVMDYVAQFYAGSSLTLAQTIYGKRAASSLYAVAETLRRREAALKQPGSAAATLVPDDLLTDLGLGDAADDDTAWDDAEKAVITARSTDRSGEVRTVKNLLVALDQAMSDGIPSKWEALTQTITKHNIAPGEGQLLVFTEFTDTARWLHRMFTDAGFSTEILEGSVNHHDRDSLQARFLNGDFQVLVSTDAGGEGIDLQSANVMINYDLPWSMVRLEQRGGRLHRVGQQREVYVYHLVAPNTREGRVQEVMLNNLDAASEALEGKVYDLLDATAERAGFDWGKAMLDAQAGREVHIPDTGALIVAAQGIVAEERSLATPANLSDALDPFAKDRLEAINPVIVDAMVDQIARSSDWRINPGPAQGIRLVTAQHELLPPALNEEQSALIAADGGSVRQAINDGAAGLDDVIVLGPTEEPFQELVTFAMQQGEADLARGTALVDTGSLTSYILMLFDADIQLHDGTKRTTRKSPFLIRCSADQAIPVAWESLMAIRTPMPGDPQPATALTLKPALRHDATRAAEAALEEQRNVLIRERQDWIAAAESQLEATQYRFEENIRDRPLAERKALLEAFERDKQHRLSALQDVKAVQASAVRLIGWVAVVGGARTDELGYDPNSEKVAVSTVVAELERLGFTVDDRQTAGVGYDLYARNPQTREQRLVEVKGLKDGLRAIWLEQDEWGQAQQRKNDYWLYVVDSCSTKPTIRLRVQNPADVLGGPKVIERVQIPMSKLTRLAESRQ
jgi:superfamily II DNA or RNA helicase